MSEKNAPAIKPVTTHFLHMKGLMMKNGKDPVSKASIEVYYTDSEVRYASVKSGGTGWCQFKLPLQSHFLIIFKKDGYIAKKITVDTHVPTKKINNYYCEFESELFPVVAEVDAAPLLKEPVTNFFFKEKAKHFYYDKENADKINAQIKGMYVEYYAAQEKEKTKNLTSTKSTRRIPEVLK